MVLSTQQLVSVIIILGLLIGGTVGGAYLHIQTNSSVTCLGCLGLSPISGEFEEFWVDYPDDHAKAGQPVGHPNWILDALDEYQVIVLFFWQIGCEPCDAQWEDMKDNDLVKGTEETGKLKKYADIAYLYSLDINDDPKYRSAMYTYDPDGARQGTPTTVFLLKLDINTVGWYSYKGYMDAETVEGIMTIGLNMH